MNTQPCRIGVYSQNNLNSEIFQKSDLKPQLPKHNSEILYMIGENLKKIFPKITEECTKKLTEKLEPILEKNKNSIEEIKNKLQEVNTEYKKIVEETKKCYRMETKNLVKDTKIIKRKANELSTLFTEKEEIMKRKKEEILKHAEAMRNSINSGNNSTTGNKEKISFNDFFEYSSHIGKFKKELVENFNKMTIDLKKEKIEKNKKINNFFKIEKIKQVKNFKHLDNIIDKQSFELKGNKNKIEAVIVKTADVVDNNNTNSIVHRNNAFLYSFLKQDEENKNSNLVYN
jgi:hypothetical protein